MEIVQGIVIGVASGLTLGGLAWLRNWFVRWEQICYFRDLLIHGRKTLYSAQALNDGATPFVSRDMVRAHLYQEIRRNLTEALKGRASQLSFDEISSLASPLGLPDWILAMEEDKQTKQKKVPPLKVYTMMFVEWEQLTWLEFPPYDGQIPDA